MLILNMASIRPMAVIYVRITYIFTALMDNINIKECWLVS